MATINFTPTQVARLGAAFGALRGLVDEQGLPRPATPQEVRQEIWRWLGTTVRSYERAQAVKTITTEAFDEEV